MTRSIKPAAIAAAALAFALPAWQAQAQTYVFNDEFNGAAGSQPDPAKWEQQTGCEWGGGAEDQCYTDGGRNARLNGAGQLVITARREDYNGYRYTSARLMSKQSHAKGRVQVRAKMSGWQSGAWPAIWTLGQPEALWPRHGELDLMENGLNGSRWRPEYHVHTETSGEGGEYAIDPSQWHVYEVRWSPGTAAKASFYVDGRLVKTLPYAVPANSPSTVLLNIAVGSYAGTPDPALNSTMTIDYVRVSALP
jgi:beta-glucanase (GH16 family)